MSMSMSMLWVRDRDWEVELLAGVNTEGNLSVILGRYWRKLKKVKSVDGPHHIHTHTHTHSVGSFESDIMA
jgi:hypothetical protein